MADQKTVSTVSHFKLDLGGPEGALLFASASWGGATLNTAEFRTVDANGNPVNSIGGGTQVQWGELTVTRGVDNDHQLWDLFKDVKENGATPDNARDIKLIALTSKNETMCTFNFIGSHITNITFSAADAQQGNATWIHGASWRYEDMDIDWG